MLIAPGTRLGPYEILAPIGAGGMGEVYRGRDTRLERQVAIKVLPERFSRDKNALARFELEVKAVAPSFTPTFWPFTILESKRKPRSPSPSF